MKSRNAKALIHAIFSCEDCPAIWEWYLTAQRLAIAHARKHQHRVSGEVGFSVRYDGKAQP
jgi:hypothetical protein